jgi:tetratricopeptide (TPR) repeat protein
VRKTRELPLSWDQWSVEDHYSELVHQYRQSENTEKAIAYLHLAGLQAVQRSANAYARRALTDAWDLLQSVPDTADRHRQELPILLALGPLWIAAKGWGTPEVERVYRRAQEVCRLVDDRNQLVVVLSGLSYFYSSRAEYQTAYALAEQLHQIAGGVADPELHVYDHAVMGPVLFRQGKIGQAYKHWEHGRTLYAAQPCPHVAIYIGADPGLACTAFSAFSLWYFGYPDQAEQRVREAFRLAEGLTHTFSRTIGHVYAAWVYQLRRDMRASLQQAEAGMAAAQENGFPNLVAWSREYRGGALIHLGHVEEGLAEVRQGLVEIEGAEMKNRLYSE